MVSFEDDSSESECSESDGEGDTSAQEETSTAAVARAVVTHDNAPDDATLSLATSSAQLDLVAEAFERASRITTNRSSGASVITLPVPSGSYELATLRTRTTRAATVQLQVRAPGFIAGLFTSDEFQAEAEAETAAMVARSSELADADAA